jgi:hypothetical protein
MKITLGWLVFIILEMIAVVSAFTWELTTSALRPVLWLAQFFLLMPGRILVGLLIEKFLWNTGLSLRMLGIMELIGSIAVNAIVWLLLLQIVRRLRRHYAL